MSEQKSKKKKRQLKPRAMDFVCLTCGIVIGKVVATLTQNIGFLKWLSYEVPFGFEEPIPLSFVIFKVQFGFSIHLSAAVVLFALLALFTGRFMLASAKKKRSAPSGEESDR